MALETKIDRYQKVHTFKSGESLWMPISPAASDAKLIATFNGLENRNDLAAGLLDNAKDAAAFALFAWYHVHGDAKVEKYVPVVVCTPPDPSCDGAGTSLLRWREAYRHESAAFKFLALRVNRLNSLVIAMRSVTISKHDTSAAFAERCEQLGQKKQPAWQVLRDLTADECKVLQLVRDAPTASTNKADAQAEPVAEAKRDKAATRSPKRKSAKAQEGVSEPVAIAAATLVAESGSTKVAKVGEADSAPVNARKSEPVAITEPATAPAPRGTGPSTLTAGASTSNATPVAPSIAATPAPTPEKTTETKKRDESRDVKQQSNGTDPTPVERKNKDKQKDDKGKEKGQEKSKDKNVEKKATTSSRRLHQDGQRSSTVATTSSSATLTATVANKTWESILEKSHRRLCEQLETLKLTSDARDALKHSFAIEIDLSLKLLLGVANKVGAALNESAQALLKSAMQDIHSNGWVGNDADRAVYANAVLKTILPHVTNVHPSASP